VKVTPELATCSSPAVVTVSVTATETMGVADVGADMLMVPAHVPACNPVVLICTLNAAGADPICGETASQLPPHCSDAALAVKAMALAEVVAKFRVRAAGPAAPS
jgi:hypothetical protein